MTKLPSVRHQSSERLASPCGVLESTLRANEGRVLFVEINAPDAFNAGKKAFDDVNSILRKAGLDSILIDRDQSSFHRLLKAPLLMYRLARAFLSRGKIIVIQTPIPKEARGIVRRLLRISQAKTVMLIHDIDSMRYSERMQQLGSELSLFESADVVIAHNEAMKAWLQQRGLKKPIVSMDLFDYLIPSARGIGVLDADADFSPKGCHNWRREIVFAGSLAAAKSGFIYRLTEKIPLTLHAFGALPLSEHSFPATVRYCGAFAPGSPTIPGGLFGLVWDGPDTGTCSGTGGNYLKLNSPHKVSLYVACGLPILCWRESAVAEYVESESLGLAVASLEEIPEALASLPQSAFTKMLDSVAMAGSRLRSGGQLANALNSAVFQANNDMRTAAAGAQVDN